MKKYKYITIGDLDGGYYNGRPYFRILNNRSGVELGMIYFYKQWKQYVFTSSPECVFNVDCLKDIIDYITNEIPPQSNV